MINLKIAESVKVNGDYSVFITSDYNAKLVEVVRSFPSKSWNNENKTWEIPLNKLATLLEKLPEFEFDIVGLTTLREQTVEKPVNFDFKTNPFEHQIEGFNFGLNHDRWLLGDEQGLGKTKQVIDIAIAKKLQCGYKHCLIICGVNGLKWNWQNEIKIHSNETGHILGQRTRKNGKVVIGSNKDKLDDLLNADTLESYFLITNIESLRDEHITSKISELCKNNDIGLVAIDEVHKCKNPSSQQGKAMLKIQPKFRIAMTGTPLMNTPLDLFIIMKWLGYEKHSFYQFKNHYCVLGGFGGYDVIGYKNLSELQENLNHIMLRRLKSDVFDLPEKLYIEEYVDMSPKQAQIYKEVSMSIKSNIDQIKMANNPLAELIRLRQATGYTGILSSTIQESTKLDRMEELVDEAVENGKKVVVFSNWTQMTDVIWTRLSNKYKGTIITGNTNDAERQVNVNTFQTDNDCKFIVGTIGAMGTGLTLTAGTIVIFMDEPWTMAAKVQAEDRCHRIGTNENVTIYTIMCKDTIDERIHDIVLEKGEMSDSLVDGKIIGDKKALLDYLLS